MQIILQICVGYLQEEEAASNALSIDHVGGVFVVLVAGCVVAIIFAFIEFFWENRKIASEEGVRYTRKILAILLLMSYYHRLLSGF